MMILLVTSMCKLMIELFKIGSVWVKLRITAHVVFLLQIRTNKYSSPMHSIPHAFQVVNSIAVLEIAAGHWLLSNQFQYLADQNPFWLAKFTVHFQWNCNQ